MLKKRLLLCLSVMSLLISNKNMASNYSPEKIIGYTLVGGVAAGVAIAATYAVGAAVYKLGEDCDLWGGPNPQALVDGALEEYNESFTLVKDRVQLNESFLQSVAEKQVDRWRFRLVADQLKSRKTNLIDCLDYMQKSSRYGAEAISKSQISQWVEKVGKRAEFMHSVANYIESCSDYFSLYKEEILYSVKYAHERSLYEVFVYQPNTLKAELYATATAKYGHAYAIVDYAAQLNIDMIAFAKVMHAPYTRAASARQLYDILQAMHTLIINDQVFVQTAQQYAYWQEQNRLARERERVERERQLAYDLHAGYQYANGYYNGQADAGWQTYNAQQKAQRAQEKADRLERERRAEARRADDARNDARRHQQNADYERAKANRERAEKERLQQEKDVEDRRKREAEELQRQERARQEQEAEKKRVAQQQEAARQEVERQESIRKRAAEREAREREEAEDVCRREREEQQRQMRKQQEMEAEKLAAQKEADRKFEEDRYNTFDRFQ